MGMINLINKGKKIFSIFDVACDEVAMIALALLAAKYFSVVTTLSWYWYVIVFVVFVSRPLYVLIKE